MEHAGVGAYNELVFDINPLNRKRKVNFMGKQVADDIVREIKEIPDEDIMTL